MKSTAQIDSNQTEATIKEATKQSEEEVSNQAALIANALEQFKGATNALYQAMGSMGSATGDAAKLKLVEGKQRALAIERKVEGAIADKPLIYVGAAFVTGWLVSRLMK